MDSIATSKVNCSVRSRRVDRPNRSLRLVVFSISKTKTIGEHVTTTEHGGIYHRLEVAWILGRLIGVIEFGGESIYALEFSNTDTTIDATKLVPSGSDDKYLNLTLSMRR
jgi:hypothetical protein